MSTAAEHRRAWLAALALPWIAAGWLLRAMWGYDTDRYFGFAVLPLAAYLFFLWWETRPAAQPRRAAGWTALAVAGALTLGGGGLFLSVSPLWTFAGWVSLAGAAAMTLGLLGRAGGWPWVRGGLVPAAFAFMALPWPVTVGGPTVTWLRGINASLAADLVSVFGRPAVAHGAMIETGGGWVGVEDGCSGFVALQTALMLAVFFGELRRLRARDRVILALGAALIALGVNLARVTWLVWRAAHDGSGGVLAGHDAAGWAELGVAMVAVIIWASVYGRPAMAEEQAGGGGTPDFSPKGMLLPTATLVVALLGIAGWYALPAKMSAAHDVRWQLVRPDAGWRVLPLAPAVLEQLHAEQIDYTMWHDETADRDWIALHLRWGFDPALRYGPGLHGPEICLPNAGAELQAKLGVQTVELGGVAVDFQWLRFTAGGRVFHTFSCIWDPSLARTVDVESLAALDLAQERLARVRERRRQSGLERITLAVNQCRDDAEAQRLLRSMAQRLLRRE
ncbi:MAG: exosortase/archaeosortase family protein [Verrucomicrobia bacterium]|nr:exosortase/archaeosortase family protein [Verrucomicrobiota bacterium]